MEVFTSQEAPPEERNTTPAGPHARAERLQAAVLLATVFVVAACGLIYELLLAAVSSYLVGSSVTQFSLCIGIFIGAMGLGSWLSQYVSGDLLRWFLRFEIALAAAGGVSVWLLFTAYAWLGAGYWAVLFGILTLIGTLTGLEIPLLTRLLSGYGTLRATIAHVLSFDYVGALLGSVAFPLLLLPFLGITRTAFAVSLLNVLAAAGNLFLFRRRLERPRILVAACTVLALVLVVGLLFSDRGISRMERMLYEGEVIHAGQSAYQRIVLTRAGRDLRLYLDGNIQFSSLDEYRYHEALVHPAMALSASREDVLILGGGDGLAVREVLRWPDVRRVTLVDIDPAMTRLARTYPAVAELNGGALADPRVRLVHEDAFRFLQHDTTLYGVILSDLPDPTADGLAKLYSREFYRLLGRRLARAGLCAVQGTSPLLNREAFWCIEHTLKEAGLAVTPYHAYVPSFGDWGFLLASAGRQAPDLSAARVDRVSTRFLLPGSLPGLLAFDGDTTRTAVEASTLDQPRVLHYYQQGVRRWQ